MSVSIDYDKANARTQSPASVASAAAEGAATIIVQPVADSSAMFDLLSAAWDRAIAEGMNIYLPAGTYDISDANFPFRRPEPISSLLDCGGISIFGDGPSTVLRTTSADGADVLNLNGLKRLSVRNLAIEATLTGSSGSGSNGISITNGFDELDLLDIWVTDMPSVDKTTYIDGGKGLTFQGHDSNTYWGSCRARVYVKGCAEGVGADFDLVELQGDQTAIDVEIVARNCHQAVKLSAGAASGAVTAGWASGFRIRGLAVDCQRDVYLSRAHGADVDLRVVTTKSAAARRLAPSGSGWTSADPVVEAVRLAYAKHARVSVAGYKGACDYKARIGAASAGSSGQNGATSNCDIYLDIGGVAGASDIAAVTVSSTDLHKSTLRLSEVTATSVPSVFKAPAKGNHVDLGTELQGTWTPIFYASADPTPIGFTINDARYEKHGNVVTASFDVTRNDAGAISGAVVWSLPFASANSAAVGAIGTWYSPSVTLGGLVLSDNPAVGKANAMRGDTNASLSYANIVNGNRLRATFTYLAA